MVLNLNDYKRMQTSDSIETYTHWTSKDLVSEKEEIKCNKITKQCKKLFKLVMLQKKT